MKLKVKINHGFDNTRETMFSDESEIFKPATCLRFQQGVFFQVNASSKCFCLFTLINNQGHHNINLPKMRVLFIWKYLPPGSYCSCTGSSAAPPLVDQVLKYFLSVWIIRQSLLIKSWSYQSTFINKIFFSLTTI